MKQLFQMIFYSLTYKLYATSKLFFFKLNIKTIFYIDEVILNLDVPDA